jgi:hypothetical protein
LVGALLAFASSSCTLVADLDSYVSADSIGCDMSVAVGAFNPHVADRVVFQAVTRDGNELRAMAIIDALAVPDRNFTMPNAIRGGAHALLIWHDGERNEMVNPISISGNDHSWRLEDACGFPSTCENGEPNCFAHDGRFDIFEDPVTTGNDVEIRLPNLSLETRLFEMHLVEIDAVTEINSVVGLYRTELARVTEGPFVARLPGLAVPGRTYTVDLLIDLNGDTAFQGETEVFAVAARDGAAFASPIVFDIAMSDPTGDLPEQGILVSPAPPPGSR